MLMPHAGTVAAALRACRYAQAGLLRRRSPRLRGAQGGSTPRVGPMTGR
ncbi:hypothetical protein ACWCQN_38985 [Streptomyces sp. NPDC001984]